MGLYTAVFKICYLHFPHQSSPLDKTLSNSMYLPFLSPISVRSTQILNFFLTLKRLFSRRFPSKILYSFLFSSILTTFPTHQSLLVNCTLALLVTCIDQVHRYAALTLATSSASCSLGPLLTYTYYDFKTYAHACKEAKGSPAECELGFSNLFY